MPGANTDANHFSERVYGNSVDGLDGAPRAPLERTHPCACPTREHMGSSAPDDRQLGSCDVIGRTADVRINALSGTAYPRAATWFQITGRTWHRRAVEEFRLSSTKSDSRRSCPGASPPSEDLAAH